MERTSIPRSLSIEVLPGRFAVCRLPSAGVVVNPARAPFFSSTWTPEETSVVCLEAECPSEALLCEKGWRIFKVRGPLDFSCVGILASLTGSLAEAGVTIFALSTYDTDYLLIKETSLENAIEALRARGHEVI